MVTNGHEERLKKEYTPLEYHESKFLKSNKPISIARSVAIPDPS
jgi:hypothetical protein